MENKEDLLKIIEEKFDARIELSDEFKTRLMTIPSISRTYRKNNWLLVAGVAVLVSLNVLGIAKQTKTNKQNYIIEQYSMNSLSTVSYE
jgi:hypothetical protein